MDTSYDKVISYLTEEQGLSLKEAEEIMVLCIEQGMNPVEIFGRGLVNMLNLLPKKKKVEPPKPQPTGTPAQGNLLTKKGTAQNFTGGRTPFTSTSPVPAASSPLPKPPTKPAVSPGQMRIPGMSDRAQALRNVTRNPNTGMPGGSNAGLTMSGGSAAARNQSIFKPQPTRTAPSLPKPPSAATLSRGARLLKNLKGPAAVAAEIGAEMALEPVAKAGGRALTRTILDIMGKGNRSRQVAPSLYGKAGPDFTPDIAKGIQQRSKLAQQSAETQAASQPKPQPTGERSAAANAERQELAKAEAQRRREAAAPKPAPKPLTAKERAYGARSKLTAAQQELNRQYDIDRGLKDGRVTKPTSSALDKYLAKRKK